MISVDAKVLHMTRVRTTAVCGYRYLNKLWWIMRVDAGASVAYPRTDRPDFVAAVAGSTWLAAVVLGSCSHHEEQLEAFRPRLGAWVGHHQAMQHHRRHRHRSHYQKARVHSDMPSQGQLGNTREVGCCILE